MAADEKSVGRGWWGPPKGDHTGKLRLNVTGQRIFKGYKNTGSPKLPYANETIEYLDSHHRQQKKLPSDPIYVSPTNNKIGGPSVSLYPITTCRGDAPCKKECYAVKMAGNDYYDSSRSTWKHNTRVWYNEPERFEKELGDSIAKLAKYHAKKGTQAYFRYHASGDMPDENYRDMIVRLAEKHPTVSFWLPTKKWELIDSLPDNKIPDNLKIMLSEWPGLIYPERLYSKKNVHSGYYYDWDNPDIRLNKIDKNKITMCPGDCISCGNKCHDTKKTTVFVRHSWGSTESRKHKKATEILNERISKGVPLVQEEDYDKEHGILNGLKFGTTKKKV